MSTPTKVKTYTEDEVNKKVVKAVEFARDRKFTFDLHLGHLHHNSTAAEFTIRCSGGDPTELRKLAIQLQQLVIEYAANIKEDTVELERPEVLEIERLGDPQ